MIHESRKLKMFLTIIILNLYIFLFSLNINSRASCTLKVVNVGESIQEAINNATAGETILITCGVHVERSYPIIVNKSLTLIGEDFKNTIINGNGTDRGIFLVKANYVRIGNLTIKNTAESYGVSGIHLVNSQYNEIFHSIIKECGSGIQLTNSSYNVITRNNITSNHSVGIYLHSSSSNNLIFGNTIAYNNSTGLWISDFKSSNNKIFHNSFINNNMQQSSIGSATVWDNGYPSGGNYWSDHYNIDIYHGVYQNISGSDGLADEDYNGIDRYPLVEPPIFIHLYSADQDYYALILTNLSVSRFYFNPVMGSFINFTVEGKNAGFCRISVPNDILWVGDEEEWVITINETVIENPVIFEDQECTHFYLQFNEGLFNVNIQGSHVIPESFSIIELLFIFSTLSFLLRVKSLIASS